MSEGGVSSSGIVNQPSTTGRRVAMAALRLGGSDDLSERAGRIAGFRAVAAGPGRPAYPVAVSATELPPADDAAVETALHLLCDSALEPIVELVLLARDGGYEAHAHD
jgi:hypothetical protein